MASLSTAPAAVLAWFAARTSTEPAANLAPTLAPSATLTFAGRRIEGREAVIERLLAMPSGGKDGAAQMELSVLPRATADKLTVRGTGPGGVPLPSPGGPMEAMDFTFTIDSAGLISSITPHPHHSEPADLSQPLQPGQQAPGFTLPDVAGVPVDLDAASSAATVVLFTCNPCPWALGWHGRLQDVVTDYAERGVRVLQINANDPGVSPKDATEHSRERVEAGEFAGPYLVDEGQRVARAWGARHTPDVFVLDASGVVAYHGAPDTDVDDPTLRADWLRDALDAVLTGEDVTLAQTAPVGCTIKWTL